MARLMRKEMAGICLLALMALSCANPCRWEPTSWEPPAPEANEAGCWVLRAPAGGGFELKDSNACELPPSCVVELPGNFEILAGPIVYLQDTEAEEPGWPSVTRGTPCSDSACEVSMAHEAVVVNLPGGG